MADVNVSLPDAMMRWIDSQTVSGRYLDYSDYIRDLIRQDQVRKAKIAAMQMLVDEGIESGVSEEGMEDILRSLKTAAE